MREEDFSAEQPSPQAQARFSSSDSGSRRACHPETAAPEGSHPAVGLIWRVHRRALFQELARAPRHHRGALVVTRVCGSPNIPTQVAYSIGRGIGNSVVRNRVRRRLRAAVRSLRESFCPGCAYLIRVSPQVRGASYQELRASLEQILQGMPAAGR